MTTLCYHKAETTAAINILPYQHTRSVGRVVDLYQGLFQHVHCVDTSLLPLCNFCAFHSLTVVFIITTPPTSAAVAYDGASRQAELPLPQVTKQVKVFLFAHRAEDFV